MVKNTIIAVSLLTLVLAGSAQSVTIGNGPPNQTGGSDLNGFLEADNFSLATPSLLNQVTYWSLQTNAADYAGTTAWGIYSDAAGSPGSALFSGSAVATGVATGNTTLGLNEFMYSFSLAVPLASGNYWLVLHNGPTGTIPVTDYYWAWSSNAGNSQSNDLLAPAWVGNDAELAFQLTLTAASNAVPDSGRTLGLFGMGLCALAFAQGARRSAPKST